MTRRITVFRPLHWWERTLETAFPARRRRREARIEAEIRRLCTTGIDDEVIFLD